MIIKQGVQIAGLKPVMQTALNWAQEIYEEYKLPLVITSGLEGKHMENSKHYTGEAVDIRTYQIEHSTEKYEIVSKLRKGLEDLGFQVILEETHIHIEHDPK